MKKRNVFWLVFGLSFCLCFNSKGQDGEAIFKQNCIACHILGQKLIGPDLIGVNDKRSEDWLISFIKSSQSMIKSGDPQALAIYEEFNQLMMNDQAHLSNEDIKAVLHYIAKQETTDDPIENIVEQEFVPIEFSSEDVANGQSLFSGKKPFKNGGPSCISCHNVTNNNLISGGRIAKDLTNAYSRMGHAGITSIITASPFPAMSTAYSDSPLDSSEVSQLSGFLKHADNVSAEQKINSGANYFVLGGGGGVIILFLLIGLLWKERLRQSVKEDIYKR